MSEKMKLRPLQEQSLDKLRQAFAEGHKSVMLYAAPGFGKTEISIALLEAAQQKGNQSAMILDRVVLCDQTSRRLDKYGIGHGVLQSGHWRYRPDERIQVCSAQTLEKRGSFPGLKLMIVDEAHCQRRQTTEFIKNNPHIKVVGLSGSPFTGGLANTYETVVSAATTAELVDQGWLAPLRVFVSKQIDMTGAAKVGGEWTTQDATARGIQVTGDIVSSWIAKTHEIFGSPKKTIVFCAGVEHGADLSRKFAEAGYNFVSLSYKDDDEFKRQVIEDFAKPDTQIHGLIATDILTKGFDDAGVMIGVSARPFSKSFSSHVQQLGRVMRSHPEKEFAVWLDHSGNFLRFKDDWDDLYQNGVTELKDGREKAKKEPTEQEKRESKCPACEALWMGGDTCLHCGFVRPRRSEVVESPGELIELKPEKKEKYDSATKERWFRELLGYARSKKRADGSPFSDGWAFHKYVDKFGIQPAWKKEPLPPSKEVLGWITSQNIRNSFRNKKAA